MITKESLQNPFLPAVSWAESLWNKASSNWAYRSGQDLNYRTHVINPFLESAVADLLKGKPVNILELGCGDGILLDSERINALIGENGNYTGVDTSGILLEKASKNHPGKNIRFIKSNLSESSVFGKISLVTSGWNIIISVFVIQEIADIKMFAKNLSELMNENVSAVLVTVHPDFAEWLKDMERIPENPSLRPDCYNNKTQWRWAGSYPIVDENHGTFYLPYFHRELEDYIELFGNEGLFIEKKAELPNPEEIITLSEMKISPFFSFKNNDYWPMITKIPSAEAFIIRKRINLV